MLERIASRLIMKEIDLKEYNKDEFTFYEIEDIIKTDLEIFSRNPKSAQQIEEEEKENKVHSRSPKKKKESPIEASEKEKQIVKDTIDYIMDRRDTVSLSELTDLLSKPILMNL